MNNGCINREPKQYERNIIKSIKNLFKLKKKIIKDMKNNYRY